MKTYHKKRLLKLADRLDEVDPVHFNMRIWARSLHPCQTAGCAVGYATTIPSFRRAGLKLDVLELTPVYVVKGETPVAGYGLAAAALFFDLYEDEAEYLFLAESYGSALAGDILPSTVAQRIRKLVAKTN